MPGRSVLDGYRNGDDTPTDGGVMPRARREELIVRHVGGEVLIADPTNHQVHWLNGIAALIWGLCDGQTSTATARASLQEHGSARAADEIVALAVLRFRHRKLLHDPDGPAELGPLPTRRALARRIRASGLRPLDPVVTSKSLGATVHAEGFGPCREIDEPCGVAQPPCSPGLRCHTLRLPIGTCV